MYVLLKDYNIKPWERAMAYDNNGAPIVYEQDINTIMGFRRLEIERDKRKEREHDPNKKKWQKGLKDKAAGIDFSKLPQ